MKSPPLVGGDSARSSMRARSVPPSFHALDPWRTRRPGLERVGKILGLAGHLAIDNRADTDLGEVRTYLRFGNGRR